MRVFQAVASLVVTACRVVPIRPPSSFVSNESAATDSRARAGASSRIGAGRCCTSHRRRAELRRRHDDNRNTRQREGDGCPRSYDRQELSIESPASHAPCHDSRDGGREPNLASTNASGVLVCRQVLASCHSWFYGSRLQSVCLTQPNEADRARVGEAAMRIVHQSGPHLVSQCVVKLYHSIVSIS